MILKFQDQSYQKWQEEFNKLENNFDTFRNYFNENKKCKCDIDECKHFEKALVNVLREKTNNIFQARLNIGFKTHYEATRKN